MQVFRCAVVACLVATLGAQVAPARTIDPGPLDFDPMPVPRMAVLRQEPTAVDTLTSLLNRAEGGADWCRPGDLGACHPHQEDAPEWSDIQMCYADEYVDDPGFYGEITEVLGTDLFDPDISGPTSTPVTFSPAERKTGGGGTPTRRRTTGATCATTLFCTGSTPDPWTPVPHGPDPLPPPPAPPEPTDPGVPVSPVPLPLPLALMAVNLALLGLVRRRR